MVSDFEGWLRSLINYCDFQVSAQLFEELLQEHERLRPSKENVEKHIRKGKPGDYREKLTPETVDYIEQKLLPILQEFHYV